MSLHSDAVVVRVVQGLVPDFILLFVNVHCGCSDLLGVYQDVPNGEYRPVFIDRDQAVPCDFNGAAVYELAHFQPGEASEVEADLFVGIWQINFNTVVNGICFNFAFDFCEHGL